MKKLICLLLCLALCLSLFVGCQSSEEQPKKDDDKVQSGDDNADKNENPDDNEDPADPEKPNEGEKPGDDEPEKDPITSATEKTLEALWSNISAPAEGVVNILKHGEMVIEVEGILENTLRTDSTTSSFANDLTINMGGAYLNVGLYGSGSEIAVECPLLFTETYGIDLETALADLSNSALMAELGLDEAVLNEMMGEMQPILDMLDNTAAQEAVITLLEDLNEVVEGLETTTEDTTVTVNGADIEVTNITYVVGEDDMIAMADAIDVFMAAVSESFDAGEDLSVSADSLSAELQEALEQGEMECEYVTSISKSSGCIAKLAFDITMIVEEETRSIEMAMELGEEPGDCFLVSLVAAEDGNPVMEASAALTTETADGKTVYSLTAEASEDGEGESLYITFTHNQQTGAYDLDINGMASAAGTLKLSDSQFILTVETVEAEGETMEIGLSITANSITDDVSKEFPSDYLNVLRLTGDELDELMLVLANFGIGVEPDYDYDYSEDDFEYSEEIEYIG